MGSNLYIEADCGQPNFGTLPGCLSLLSVDCEHQVYPPIMNGIASFFFNSADPASDPEVYLESLYALIEKSKGLKGKLVVNTCGWVDGFGAVLL
jgi:polynucleotide 5'-kinase involved in rRNA processing